MFIIYNTYYIYTYSKHRRIHTNIQHYNKTSSAQVITLYHQYNIMSARTKCTIKIVSSGVATEGFSGDELLPSPQGYVFDFRLPTIYYIHTCACTLLLLFSTVAERYCTYTYFGTREFNETTIIPARTSGVKRIFYTTCDRLMQP